MDQREVWLALVADADRASGSAHAVDVAETIRRIVGAEPGTPLAAAVIGDPRTAAELTAAYLEDWQARHPELRWAV